MFSRVRYILHRSSWDGILDLQSSISQFGVLAFTAYQSRFTSGKPKTQKYNYPIQSNAYLSRRIFEYYLMDLFQITVSQVSNITGSKSRQK